MSNYIYLIHTNYIFDFKCCFRVNEKLSKNRRKLSKNRRKLSKNRRKLSKNEFPQESHRQDEDSRRNAKQSNNQNEQGKKKCRHCSLSFSIRPNLSTRMQPTFFVHCLY